MKSMYWREALNKGIINLTIKKETWDRLIRTMKSEKVISQVNEVGTGGIIKNIKEHKYYALSSWTFCFI